MTKSQGMSCLRNQVTPIRMQTRGPSTGGKRTSKDAKIYEH